MYYKSSGQRFICYLPHPNPNSKLRLCCTEPQREEREMEAMAVFSGSNIFATSSLLRTTNSKTRYSQLRTTQNLSAFSSKSHLFSLSSTSSSYPKTFRTRSSTESGIFLPRLIASLVTLSLSLSVSAYQFIITVAKF